VWFTGLSAAGKTTLSNALFARLEADSIAVEQLDGDVIRKHLSAGLGFSKADREEHVRRIVYLASMLTRHNIVVLVSVISPSAATRDTVVDGGLIGCDIVTEKCGASAPVTLLVCLEPQDRSSGKLVSGWSFHGFTFSQVVLSVCRRCPVWTTGCGGWIY